MAADERIKVIFKRLYVKNDADWFGSGEFFFIASVDGITVGDRSQIFNAVEGTWINLPEARWSAVVDVSRKAQVVVRFQGKDDDTFYDDDLGTIQHTLRPRWEQKDHRHSTEYFTLEWSVELAIAGRFGRHTPNEVFACREHLGSVDCTTVSGAAIQARMESHPVGPVPTVGLPPRPPLPVGTLELAAVNPNNGGTAVTPVTPINVIPNPPVIPILTAVSANDNTAARIEYSYYRPNTLAFAEDDPRLEWSIVSVAGGGAASFLGRSKGLKVKVYGTAAGEVRLEMRFKGALFATYRALVMRVKQIPCRFNILNGPSAASQPRSTPANILDHLGITNRYLRQIALELILDTNVTTSNSAVAAPGTPGIFRIAVAAGMTRQIPVAQNPRPQTRLNYRPNVMNFAYIHSRFDGVLGAASDYPANGAGALITDGGTPSSSWISPTGVPPDAAAGPVNMNLLAARQRAGHPQLFAMYVTDGNGDPTTLAGQQNYANTISHEFGHILNLGHRVDTGGSPFNDGVNYPPGENLMHWNNPPALAQDFDIIQARAAHRSPLVPP